MISKNRFKTRDPFLRRTGGDVSEQKKDTWMKSLFGKKRVAEPVDVIRCDEQDYIFWKWNPLEATNTAYKAPSISYTSRLIVREDEVAIFFYRNNVTKHDVIEGPYDQIINNTDFPVLASLEKSAFDTAAPFQADVYFVNPSRNTKISLGVHYFNIYDYRFPDLGIQCGVRSALEFSIPDFKKFVILNHMNRLDSTDFKNRLENYLTFRAKEAILNIISENKIEIRQLDTNLDIISDLLKDRFASPLFKEFAITLQKYRVVSMKIDNEHPNLRG